MCDAMEAQRSHSSRKEGTSNAAGWPKTVEETDALGCGDNMETIGDIEGSRLSGVDRRELEVRKLKLCLQLTFLVKIFAMRGIRNWRAGVKGYVCL